jgi:hypothetical protein
MVSPPARAYQYVVRALGLSDVSKRAQKFGQKKFVSAGGMSEPLDFAACLVAGWGRQAKRAERRRLESPRLDRFRDRCWHGAHLGYRMSWLPATPLGALTLRT